MIGLSKVTKRYAGNNEDVLHHVSFTVDQGEFVLITGHSGAGKSTLLKLISALEIPTEGTVVIDKRNTSQLKFNDIALLRRRFGMIFQDHKLLYDRDCLHNILLPLHINNIFGSDAIKRARSALDKVGLLHKEKMMPITLSGGEQQRLSIARAVVNKPSILIADEPTANLDASYAKDIMSIFNVFNHAGVTVIIATHEAQGLVNKPCRILCLQKGILQVEENEVLG